MKNLTPRAFAVPVLSVACCLPVSALYAETAPVIANNPPKITSSNLPGAKENEAYSYQLTAEDNDENGRQLSFRLLEGPKGLRLSNSGELSFTPNFKEAGEYTVLVSVSDGELSDEKRFKLEVANTNRLPEITTARLPDAKENSAYSQQLNAIDADGEALTFKLKAEPKGMKIEGDKLIWQPNYEQAGSYSFTLLASDPFDTVSKALNITAQNTNRPPFYEGKPLYNIDENETVTIPLRADDPDEGDSEALQFTLVTGPMGLSIDSQGNLNWQPNYEQAGEYTVDFQISDGDLTVKESVKIAVEAVNREPVVSTEAMPEATENQPYSFQFTAQDPDSEDARSLTFSLKKAPKGASLDANGKLSWTPDFTMAGEQSFTVAISDGKGESKKSFTVQVKNTNRPPLFVTPAETRAKENNSYSYKVKTDDPDGGELALTLAKGPEGMVLEGNKLLFTPSFTQAGSYTVVLEVNDNDSLAPLTAQQAFTLEVENSNRAPSFVPVTAEQTQLQETSPWQLNIVTEDADNEQVGLSLITYPKGLQLTGNTLSFTPGYEQAGTHKVVLEAFDGIDRTPYEFELTVANLNRLPVFTGSIIDAAPLNGKEDRDFSYTLTATDADRQALTFSLIKGPEGLALNGDNLVWKPSFDQAGEHEVSVAVFDSEETVETRFMIQVENTNRAPVFPTAISEVLEDQGYLYEVKATDPDGDKVTVTAVLKPEFIDFNGKRLSFKPNFKQAGSYPVELLATDGDLQTTQTFDLVVVNVNRAPVLTSKPGLTAHETLEYQYQVTATDADDEALTISLKQAPKGMEIDQGLIRWTPEYSQSGAQPVVVAVFDGIDITEQSFAVTVDNANRTPELEKIADQQIVVGDKFAYKLIASDPDGDKVTFKLSHAPKGMEVNGSGKISWKTSEKNLGRHTVIVEASDGDLKRRRHFDVEVIAEAELQAAE
jgi:hypothetical protein